MLGAAYCSVEGEARGEVARQRQRQRQATHSRARADQVRSVIRLMVRDSGGGGQGHAYLAVYIREDDMTRSSRVQIKSGGEWLGTIFFRRSTIAERNLGRSRTGRGPCSPIPIHHSCWPGPLRPLDPPGQVPRRAAGHLRIDWMLS